MKLVDEFRDKDRARRVADELARVATRPWVLMEVCGGQTHSILRYGLDSLLPAGVELVHGPGCPVCVTPVALIDRAQAIAARPETTLASFGDMLRVPGSAGSLYDVKAQGGDVRVVYSPLDALRLAERHPERQVVFFAVGFETTAPANAGAVLMAHARRVPNFSILVSHVLVPPALTAILAAPDNRVQAFLGPGHVCAVMGTAEYEALADRHRVPIAIAGFEPVDILAGVLACVRALEEGRHGAENHYPRAVGPAGNPRARAAVEQVFEVVDRDWRGIGTIPSSGLALRPAFAAYDATRRFPDPAAPRPESPDCRAGEVLRGLLKPPACPAFGTTCTPEHPLGATMVSSEGACAAYFSYRATGGRP